LWSGWGGLLGCCGWVTSVPQVMEMELGGRGQRDGADICGRIRWYEGEAFTAQADS
jgi:hypothetical protein